MYILCFGSSQSVNCFLEYLKNIPFFVRTYLTSRTQLYFCNTESCARRPHKYMVPFGRLVVLLCTYAVQGALDTSRHRGSRRRLEWNRFKCRADGAYNLRLGFAVDEGFLQRYSSEEDCEVKLRAVAKSASNVFQNNFGFGIEVSHVIFPRDFTPRDERLGTACQGSSAHRLNQFEAFKKDKLSDKPAAVWYFWTKCSLGAPGRAFIATMCTTQTNVGAQSMESDMILVHELGHSMGSEHTNEGIMAGKHNHKNERGQFSKEKEGDMCDVINYSLRKGPRPRQFRQIRSQLDKDLCWAKADGGSDKGATTAPSPTSTTTKAKSPTSTTTKAKSPTSTTTKAKSPTSTTTKATESPTSTTTKTTVSPTSTTTKAESPTSTTTTHPSDSDGMGDIVLYVVIATLILVSAIVLYIVHRKRGDDTPTTSARFSTQSTDFELKARRRAKVDAKAARMLKKSRSGNRRRE